MAAGKLASHGPELEMAERLLVEAAQKDPTRFAELYELNFERVYALIARRTRNRAEAEDLTAEVFHKALANLPRYKSRGAPFAAWLFRIATNLIADRAKLSSRESDLTAVEVMQDSDQQPAIEAVERQSRLFRLVRELPADQQR